MLVKWIHGQQKTVHSAWTKNQHEILSRKFKAKHPSGNSQHFRFIYFLMCWARSDMVQCLQIRPVSLKHTSTQQLLMKVFVWHSFPIKKFLKLTPSVILEHAKRFSSKNVKFIFSIFCFDFFDFGFSSIFSSWLLSSFSSWIFDFDNR